MRDNEIQQKIASFPQWHYRFDLKGNLTPIFEERFANRHEQRKKYFFDPLVSLLGGSLAGRRVLDLGCNAGFWSLCAARAGCDYVLGIDGRQMHVDQANFVFEVEGVEKDRYDFVAGDLFGLDFREIGRFDIVLCLGLMYHISKHVELMEKISEVSEDVLLIDTALARLPGSSFKVRHERLDEPRSAVDREMVMTPTWDAMRDLAVQFDYKVAVLQPRFDDYEGADDYRKHRRAFLCAKQTDVTHVPAEIETTSPWTPMKSAANEQAKSGRQASDGRKDEGKSRVSELESLMQQTDSTLAELFASRRWRLTNTVGDVARRILRRNRGPTAEDRLLGIRDEYRAWSEDSKRNSKNRDSNKKA